MPSTDDLHGLPMEQLVELIRTRYHSPLREELRRLEELAERVNRAHGEEDASLARLQEAVGTLKSVLEPQLEKKEQVFFPMVLRGRGYDARIAIDRMQDEQERMTDLLSDIRTLTHDFTLPSGACRNWTALWNGLSELDRQLHEYVQLESEELFPRAMDEG